jgi:uncharacterized protein (TIGR02996 family)
MSEALFQAVCEQPWDTAARLAYADWLDGHGQSGFAALIRLQCENPDSSVSGFQMRQSRGEDDSYDPYESAWYKQLPRPAGVFWSDAFKGGFFHSVSFASPKKFKEHAATIFAAAPIDWLGMGAIRDRTMAEILSSPYLRRLESLGLTGISDEGLRLLAACPFHVRLKSLHLNAARSDKDGYLLPACLGDEGAIALAQSEYLGRLEALYLENHCIGDRGALALAESPKLRKVTFLSFGDTSHLGPPVLTRFDERFDYLNGWPTKGPSGQSPQLALRCPCCGCKTLRARGAFQICQVCFWQDDGQDDYDADSVRGGPNGIISLTLARANYRQFGACSEGFITIVRQPRPDELPDQGTGEPGPA